MTKEQFMKQFGDNWKVKNKKLFETSRGVYYSGDLLYNDKVVANYENRGDGGCTWIHFSDKTAKTVFDKFYTANNPHEFFEEGCIIKKLLDIADGVWNV